MRRAQDVAQAVVRTRSSISSWTCMGPRRRPTTMSSHNNSPESQSPLITETTSESITLSELVISNSNNNNEINQEEEEEQQQEEEDQEEEEEDLVRVVDEVVGTSAIEDITEGELWYELEKELQRHESENEDIIIQEEEEAVAKEITEEEKVFADKAESEMTISSLDVSDNLQFYPPGKTMHIVSVPGDSGRDDDDDDDDDVAAEERVGIYETPRELYSKLRLSRTMINDHYMPMYKKMMELLIKQLEDELDL